LVPSERLYKTGDRVRLLPSGEIEYLGRVDSQVKIRGFRVEPDEVETSLMQHAGVSQAAVVVCGDGPADAHLVAYVVLRDGVACSAGDVKEFLRARLPNFMVPSRVTFLDALPKTPAGKVDRQSLRSASAPVSDAVYVQPADAAQERIAALWREILRVERIGVDDNFFDVGGTSLLLAHLHARLSELFPDNAVSLIEMFQLPTVRALASRVLPQTGGAEPSPTAQRDARAAGQLRLRELAQRRLQSARSPAR
jgi:hypothetical protein